MSHDPNTGPPIAGLRSDLPQSDAMLALQRSILEEFQRFARGFGLELEWTPLLGASPAANVSEADGVLHVVVDLPGLTGKEVELTLDDNVLTLKGERRAGPAVRGNNNYRRESHFGPFQRSVRLPLPVQGELAVARMAYGVLYVDLPVHASLPASAHKIPISSD